MCKPVSLEEKEVFYYVKEKLPEFCQYKKREKVEQNQTQSKLSNNSGEPRKLCENNDLQKGGNLSHKTQKG